MAKKTEKPAVEKALPIAPIQVRFKKLDPEATIPQYKSAGASGFDFNVIIKTTIPAGLAGNNAVTTIRGTILKPGETRILDTGLAVAVPAGYELQVRPRSGLAANQKCTVLNSPGTIDCVPKGTKIRTPYGIDLIENIFKENKRPIFSFNEDEHAIEQDSIDDMWIINDLDLLEIETENDIFIKIPVTKEVYTKNGWKMAKTLDTNDEILLF